MDDVCLNCTQEHKTQVFGATCNCSNPNIVHRQKCTGCDKIIGYMIDDDYCELTKLYCSDCMNISVHKGDKKCLL